MYDNYNYPAGADTPDAPWNQTDPADIYGDEANEKIDEEINSGEDKFVDWLIEKGYVPKEYGELSDESQLDVLDNIREHDDILEEYRDSRFDDVVQHCVDLHCDDEPDYNDEKDD